MASLNGPRIYYYTTRGEFPDSKPFHGTGTCITDSDFFPVRAMSEFNQDTGPQDGHGADNLVGGDDP